MSRDDAWCGREAAKLNNLLRGLLVVEISAGKYFHYASCFNGDTEHINCFASSALLILTCPTIWDMKVKKNRLNLPNLRMDSCCLMLRKSIMLKAKQTKLRIKKVKNRLSRSQGSYDPC